MRVWAISVTLAAALLFVGCAADSGDGGEEDKPRLAIAQDADIQAFDPTQFAPSNHSFLYQLYDTLIMLDAEGAPVPRLATEWTRSDDNLAVTFHLREANFHSGRPVTAHDVLFSYEYYTTPEVGANLLERLTPVTSVEVVDDDTVTLSLSEPTPGLFDLLSTFFILDKEAIDSLSTTDAGSGPFMVSDRTPGVGFTMQKYADHWAANEISLEEVRVQVVPDSTAAGGALSTGEVDLLLQTDPLTAAEFADSDGFKVERPNAAPFTSYLMINVADAPLDSKLVRQALAHAIDRERIAEIVYPGTAEAACEPWAPGHWAFDESLADRCEFDLDKASELLDEAGVGDFTVTVNTSEDYSPGSVAAAQIMKEDFAKIGVNLDIQTFEPAKARELLLASDFQLLFHYYSEGGLDPQGMIPSGLWGPGESSRSNFTDPEYEAIADRVNSTLDQAERKQALSEFSAKVIDEAFLIPTVYTFRQYAMAADVEGLAISTAGFPILERVTVR